MFREDDEAYELEICTSPNKKYFLLKVSGQITNEFWYLSTSTPRGTFQLVVRSVHTFTDCNIRCVRENTGCSITCRGTMMILIGIITSCSHGNYFYIHTNEGGAKNFKVVKVHGELKNHLVGAYVIFFSGCNF